MINFIHPIDDSTEFLKKIYEEFIDVFGRDHVNVYAFTDDFEGESCKEKITNLPHDSTIVFLGHGRKDRLYGILDESDNAYFDLNEMNIFDQQNLFLLACQSSELLKQAFRSTSIKHSLGFGYLPTSRGEVQKIRNMRTKGTSEQDIGIFKDIIVKCVSASLISTFQKEKRLDYLNSYLRLLLHKEMNMAIFERGESGVANLIYQMCYQMNYYRS